MEGGGGGEKETRRTPLKSRLSIRVGRISESESVERSKRRTDLTVFTARKGAIGKNGMRRKRGEKAECGGRSAVGGYGRDYGTVVRVA